MPVVVQVRINSRMLQRSSADQLGTWARQRQRVVRQDGRALSWEDVGDPGGGAGRVEFPDGRDEEEDLAAEAEELWSNTI